MGALFWIQVMLSATLRYATLVLKYIRTVGEKPLFGLGVICAVVKKLQYINFPRWDISFISWMAKVRVL